MQAGSRTMGLGVAPCRAAPASLQGCSVLEALAVWQQTKLGSNNFSFFREIGLFCFHLLAYTCENTRTLFSSTSLVRGNLPTNSAFCFESYLSLRLALLFLLTDAVFSFAKIIFITLGHFLIILFFCVVKMKSG